MVIPDGFQHILRVLNTNIDGRHKVMYGLTAIKVGIQHTQDVLKPVWYYHSLHGQDMYAI